MHRQAACKGMGTTVVEGGATYAAERRRACTKRALCPECRERNAAGVHE